MTGLDAQRPLQFAARSLAVLVHDRFLRRQQRRHHFAAGGRPQAHHRVLKAHLVALLQPQAREDGPGPARLRRPLDQPFKDGARLAKVAGLHVRQRLLRRQHRGRRPGRLGAAQPVGGAAEVALAYGNARQADHGADVVRVGLEDLLVKVAALLLLVLRQVGGGHQLPQCRRRLVGAEGHGALEVGRGQAAASGERPDPPRLGKHVGFAHVAVGAGQPPQRQAVGIGGQRDEALLDRRRVVELRPALDQHREVEERTDIVGVDLLRLPVGRQREVGAAAVLQKHAEVVGNARAVTADEAQRFPCVRVGRHVRVNPSHPRRPERLMLLPQGVDIDRRAGSHTGVEHLPGNRVVTRFDPVVRRGEDTNLVGRVRVALQPLGQQPVTADHGEVAQLRAVEVARHGLHVGFVVQQVQRQRANGLAALAGGVQQMHVQPAVGHEPRVRSHAVHDLGRVGIDRPRLAAVAPGPVPVHAPCRGHE